MFGNEQAKRPICLMIQAMKSLHNRLAAITQPTSLGVKLEGCWNTQNLGNIEHQLATIQVPANSTVTADCARIEAMDTAGARVFQKLLQRLNKQNTAVKLDGLQPKFKKTARHHKC